MYVPRKATCETSIGNCVRSSPPHVNNLFDQKKIDRCCKILHVAWERRKEMTFPLCCPAAKLLNLEKRDDFVICLYATQPPQSFSLQIMQQLAGTCKTSVCSESTPQIPCIRDLPHEDIRQGIHSCCLQDTLLHLPCQKHRV